MPPKDKYTDPELRDEVKEEIHNGDKGGAPGQWSARKAQMMAAEYKKRGGGYTTDKKDQDESQQHLSKWSEEDWQTKEGSGNAKDSSGTQHRYLPKKAWENMTEEEKKETDEKKQEEGKEEGKQYVENTEKAKESRKKANEEEDEKFEEEKKKAEEKEDDAEEKKDEAKTGDKRTRGSSESASSAKKQKQDDGAAKETSSPSKKGKSNISKEDAEDDSDAKSNDKKDDSKSTSDKKEDSSKSTSDDKSDSPGTPASSSRLPKKDQHVQWKTLGNWTKGTVVEVAYEEKEVDGKKVKASKEDPRIVLKSDSSGKIAVHKPDAVFF
ncbi:hypothetical protein E4T44_04716 [Aureobasidium sp. EXF-8845]|nr:hypothetical protein E4T44_04716 [Aureobasidium sp. EXF-8845]